MMLMYTPQRCSTLTGLRRTYVADLGNVGKHIFASPFHPQTNGKLERYHRTAKASVNVFVHHSPDELVAAMDSFVRHYNYERYHEALGNVTPADMYHGKRDAILATRQEVKRKSLAERRMANLSTA